MSTRHKEFSVEIDVPEVVVSFVVNDPIVTCEVRRKDGKLETWGVSYCRPMDNWNAEVGVRLAMVSAIKRMYCFTNPEIIKKAVRHFIEKLEPVLDDLHEERKEERRREQEELKAIIQQMCGDCRVCFR